MKRMRKRFPALVSMICMTLCIALCAGFSLAETAGADENSDATTLVFVNDYTSAGSYTWEVMKAIEGRPLREGETFAFRIEALDGAPLPRNEAGETVSSYTLEVTPDEAEGYSASRSLPVIPITNADLGGAASGTFRYRMTEIPGDEQDMTYDPEPKTLRLLAEDQGDGTIAVTRVPEAEGGEDSTVFTNVYARTRGAMVTKVWDDADNQDGKRPAGLHVELHRRVTRTLGEAPDGETEDAVIADDVILNDGNNWTGRKDGLPCWDRWGNPYSYDWREYIPDGENKIYPIGDEQIITFNGAEYACEALTEEMTTASLTMTVLTNRHDPALTDKAVRKIWDDGDNETGMRPAAVTMQLYANNEPTGLSVRLGADPAFLNEGSEAVYGKVIYETGTGKADPWTATLKNLPAYAAGVLQNYTWVEADAALNAQGSRKSLKNDLYYTVTEYSVSGDTTTVTNRYVPPKAELGALEITKRITGTDATPEFAALRFRIRGPEGFDRTVTYDMFEDGKYTVADLPDGQYTIEEENAGDIAERLILRADSVTSARVTVTSGNTAEVTLTNRYDIVTTEVKVRKVWEDQNNQDGLRPQRIVMTLSNGMRTELNAGNGWSAVIGDLPMYDAAGNPITYTWREPRIRGYQLKSAATEGNETVFVNVHKPEVISATVVKIWDDADNAAGLRPVNLRVTLSNGTSYYLNEGNGWTITVNGLPAYAAGKKIVYTWSEQSELGYTSSLQTDGDVTTFTNHYYGVSGPKDGDRKTIRLPDNSLITIEDLPVPLSMGGIINHVGDTFE